MCSCHVINKQRHGGYTSGKINNNLQIPEINLFLASTALLFATPVLHFSIIFFVIISSEHRQNPNMC